MIYLFIFFRFPFYNPDITKKWFEFVKKTSKMPESTKTITKYSSICSLHFKPSEFNPHGNTTRKFLKKSAVPSIISSEKFRLGVVKDQNEILVIDDDPIIYESCGLCKTPSAQHHLSNFDEFNFTLMRKCIPFINFNINIMQRICVDCEAILNTFSSFIDKILIAQNLINQEIILQQNELQFLRNIKIEPSSEEEYSINSENSSLKIQKQPVQKKLEILEIVDIKPMNFPGNFLPYETNALISEINESYDEAAPQLKFEIADDANDELEEIKKYMLASSVCLHDHNYHHLDVNMGNVIKKEYEVREDHEISDSPVPPEINEIQFVKICCRKRFNRFKSFLLHKIIKHKKNNACKVCKKVFLNEVSLKHHKKYLCQKLTKKFYKKIIENIRKKKVSEKPKNKKFYSCPACRKLFKGPKNLYQHKLSHRVANITCKICGQIFKRKHGLKQHIAAQHERKRIYNCPTCNHPYALKGDIKRCKHSDLKKTDHRKKCIKKIKI